MIELTTATIEILMNDKDFADAIMAGVIKDLNRAFRGAIPKIEERIRRETLSIFKETDTYDSLTEGSLARQFGFTHNTEFSRVDTVVNAIANDLTIEFKPIKEVSGAMRGGLTIGLVKNDFREILDVPAGFFISENGQRIDWLEWLLTQGDRIIIAGYHFHPERGKGRSGYGIMVKGLGWKIPAKHSGTITNNWIVRTFGGAVGYLEAAYTKIISTEINKRL